MKARLSNIHLQHESELSPIHCTEKITYLLFIYRKFITKSVDVQEIYSNTIANLHFDAKTIIQIYRKQ